MDYYENSQIREPSDQYPMGIWTGDMVTVSFELGKERHGRVVTPYRWHLDWDKEYPEDRISYEMDRIEHYHRCWSTHAGTHLLIAPGNREYLIRPCNTFEVGLKIGDRIKSAGGYAGIVVGGKEWTKSGRTSDYSRPFNLRQSLYYRRDHKEFEDDHECWRTDINRCMFIERPLPQEADGQLLMF